MKYETKLKLFNTLTYVGYGLMAISVILIFLPFDKSNGWISVGLAFPGMILATAFAGVGMTTRMNKESDDYLTNFKSEMDVYSREIASLSDAEISKRVVDMAETISDWKGTLTLIETYNRWKREKLARGEKI